jgi:hypothetical protein
MSTCPLCKGELDPITSRHIDEDGQVMDYREDLTFCRPDPEVGSWAWWETQDDTTDAPASIRNLIEMSAHKR